MTTKPYILRTKRSDTTRGRPARFGVRMERQISVGIDPKREKQLSVLRDHFQQESVGPVSESDVMRVAFDRLVVALEGDLPELKTIR